MEEEEEEEEVEMKELQRLLSSGTTLNSDSWHRWFFKTLSRYNKCYRSCRSKIRRLQWPFNRTRNNLCKCCKKLHGGEEEVLLVLVGAVQLQVGRQLVARNSLKTRELQSKDLLTWDSLDMQQFRPTWHATRMRSWLQIFYLRAEGTTETVRGFSTVSILFVSSTGYLCIGGK